MDLKTAARLMNASAESLRAELFDKSIEGFSIDSRSIGPGDLFFALSQPDYERAGFNGTFLDGHDFITTAFDLGAVAAVARRGRASGDVRLREVVDRLLVVDDCIGALQSLAHEVYSAWGRPVVAITGSAGKTTAKELTAHVLSETGRTVLKSARNYNNGLGLPLSVLSMVSRGHKPEDYGLAVLEMGMSSPTHEIQRLCDITPPDIGVELLVAPVHLEYLGSIDNIAKAKAELILGLKPGGTAVLNADDERVSAMRSLHNGPTLMFGIDHRADITAVDVDSGELGVTVFRLQTPLGQADATLRMPGRHNLMNALAAAAVATCFQILPEEIALGLQSASVPAMRGEVLEFAEGFTVVDDSYNSNPRSLLGMVGTIVASQSRHPRRIVIAGEMLELGPEGSRLHRESGRDIALSGIDVIWGVQGLAREMVRGAVDAGFDPHSARFFETSEEAADALTATVRDNDLILIKGSRGVQTDKIVTQLKNRFLQSNKPKIGTGTSPPPK